MIIHHITLLACILITSLQAAPTSTPTPIKHQTVQEQFTSLHAMLPPTSTIKDEFSLACSWILYSQKMPNFFIPYSQKLLQDIAQAPDLSPEIKAELHRFIITIRNKRRNTWKQAAIIGGTTALAALAIIALIQQNKYKKEEASPPPVITPTLKPNFSEQIDKAEKEIPPRLTDQDETEMILTHALTIEHNGQSLTITSAHELIAGENELIILDSKGSKTVFATIKYEDLTKKMLTFIEETKQRTFIFNTPKLKEQFDTVVRQKETILLNRGKSIILHNEMSIDCNEMALLLYNPDDLSITTLPYAYLSSTAPELISSPFIEYWHKIDRRKEQSIRKWAAGRVRLCLCPACVLRPYPEKPELAKIILEREKTQPDYETTYTDSVIPAVSKFYQPIRGWQCRCKKQFAFESYCADCDLFACHKCKQLKFIERQRCPCHADNDWFCNMCKKICSNKANNTCNSVLSDRYGDKSVNITCRNICWDSENIPLWECTACKHTELESSAAKNCKTCGWTRPALKTLGSEIDKPAFASLKSEYTLLRRRNGGYSLHNLLYQGSTTNVIPAHSKATDIIHAPAGTYIKINPENYQDCIGDGLCGYRSVTGEFQTREQPKNSLALQLDITDRSNTALKRNIVPLGWMGSPTCAQNLIKRHIITLIPCGFTEQSLLYRAHDAGSKLCTDPEADAHHPIIVIMAIQESVHFARLLPVYPDDPSYHYEKFTISAPDASGNRTVTAERQNRNG